MQIVKDPTHGDIQFPDGTSVADMEAAIAGLGSQPKTQAPVATEQAAPKSFVESAPSGLSALPNAISQLAPSTEQAAMALVRGVDYMDKSMPAALRVGPSVIAGFTGKTGLAGSAIGGSLSALGEAAAQAKEIQLGQRPQGMEGSKIAASGIAGATPTFSGPNIGAAKSIALNAPTALAFSELSNLVSEGDKYTPPSSSDAISRVGLPVAGASVAGMASISLKGISRFYEKVEQLSKVRGGGTVMLGEAMRGYTGLEAVQLSKGNPRAIHSFNNATAKIGASIASDFSPYVGSDKAKLLMDQIVRENIIKPQEIESLVDGLVLDARKASDAAEGITSAPEVATRKTLAADAKLTALKKQLGTYAESIYTGKFLAGGIPALSEIESGAIAAGKIKNVQQQSKLVAKEYVSGLYKSSGVTENTPVISRETAIARLKDISSDKERLEMADEITRTFRGKETLSLDEYRELRDKFTNDLVAGGADRTAANRTAAKKYGYLKSASDDYMSKNLDPEQYLTFQAANARTHAMFSAEASEAVDMMERGDYQKLYDRISKEGVSQKSISGKGYDIDVSSYDGLMNYADTIQATLGGPAGVEAANRYRTGVNTMIRDGVFRSALVENASGYVSASRKYNPEFIVNAAAKLERSGVPVGRLGFGTTQEIREMAKVFSLGKTGGMTIDDASEFLSIISKGDDYGKFKDTYNKLQREFLNEKGIPDTNGINRIVARSKELGLSADAAQVALNKVKSNPLTKLLEAPTSTGGLGAYGLSSTDLTRNADFSTRLGEMETADVRKFVSALRLSGKNDVADVLGRTYVANTLMLFEDAASAASPTVKAGQIAETFFGSNTDSIKIRNNIKAMVGEADYEQIMNKFVRPLGGFASHTNDLLASGKAAGGSGDVLRGLLSIKGLASGKATAGVVVGNAVRNSMHLGGTVGYNLMYELVVGKYSKDFAKAGNNLNKFMDSSSVNATIVKVALAVQERERQQEAQKSPQ